MAIKEELRKVEDLRMNAVQKVEEIKLLSAMAIFCNDFAENRQIKEDIIKSFDIVYRTTKEVQEILNQMDEIMIRI